MRPTDSELEILHVLWEHGPRTVRQVNDELSQHREIGYTTTLKLMQIMHEKGLLTRTEDAKSHVYTAALGEQEARQTMIDRFLETTFRGSASQLVMQVLGRHKASADELDEIKKLLNNLENEAD
ncbi:BlaI/MecI/CopY family transcriptional regulator [Fibrivirga algicola]|uniref:BlaI/MecI/CopY family transcriptional regulator n=1 Tax=Fibrivirga algicola TaxID=2950420 RepID=A0ABX0QIA9_9BACT|nr:BlaI/MecI/CopY family transcriptional regulator [Fibrivirga algicola]ARK09713.1 transcriptional regulator [Fibrella sp. ES10-3-2-2]NID10603.1 BlaI/MecI/CopY family transcriptional regulator [Fibrivirga algicola]